MEESPFVSNSYERTLQMKYIDNWLNENPNDPYKSKAPVKVLRQEVGSVLLQQKLQPSPIK